MDECEDWQKALKVNHQRLRTGIIVANFLPELRSLFTDVEYSQVESKLGNVAQVDEVVRILLTKTGKHFDEFCEILERNGCQVWAKRLRNAAGRPLKVKADSEVIDRQLMAEKDCSYYPCIEAVDDEFYEKFLKSIDKFVLESSDSAFQSFRRSAERVIRHSRHVTGCKAQPSADRARFLQEIQGDYSLWENCLEYRPLREVIMSCEDEGLIKQLQQYEKLLRAKGETILYHCKKQKEMDSDLCLKLKAKHETTLATLIRMQEFLVNDVGLDDAIFTGFREGCIELYFRLSPDTASISMVPLRSDASLSKLLRLGVTRVELSDHWVLDAASGRITYLKTPQNDWLTEDSDYDTSADEVPQHKSIHPEESTQKFSRLKQPPLAKDYPHSKRTRRFSEDELSTTAASSKRTQCPPGGFEVCDEDWRMALKVNHQKLRTGIIVAYFLPELRLLFTDVEYSQVESKLDNVAQVDEVVRILLTKTGKHFDKFCEILECNGYPNWAKRLRSASSHPLQVKADSEVIEGHLMAEEDCFYYPYIEAVNDEFYEKFLKSIDKFVLESSESALQCFRQSAERVVRHSRHVTGCKAQPSSNRAKFLQEIQGKYALWESCLEYQPLREVIMSCEDEGLMKQLQQYEKLLREKGGTILYNCKKQKEMDSGLYLKLKAKHETTLATLIRMQEFLVNDVGLDDAIFTGFREGCIELYFRLPPDTASISMVPLRSDASLSKLLRLGVTRVELSDHWVLDAASGRITYLKTLQNDWLTEDSDYDTSADEASQHKSIYPEESTQKTFHLKRPPLPKDFPHSKRTKLISEDELLTTAASSEMTHSQCPPWDPERADHPMVKIGDLGQSRLKTDDYFSTGPYMPPEAKEVHLHYNVKQDRINTDQPGAVSFMSPEVMREQSHYTEKLDLFSLGVLMLEIATQQPPRVGMVGIGTIPELQHCSGDRSKLDEHHPLQPQLLTMMEGDQTVQSNASRPTNEVCSPTSTSGGGDLELGGGFGSSLRKSHAEVLDLQQKLKLKLNAMVSRRSRATSHSKGTSSGVRWKRRTMSPTSELLVLGGMQDQADVENTGEAVFAHLPLATQDETMCEAMCSTRAGVTDAPDASAKHNISSCNCELLQKCLTNDNRLDSNHPEVLPMSGDQESAELIEVDTEDEPMLLLREQGNEHPSTVCLEHNTAGSDDSLQLSLSDLDGLPKAKASISRRDNLQ